MSVLDDQKQIKKIDKGQMAKFISELPEQCLKAYNLAQKMKLPTGWKFTGRSHLPKGRSDLIENVVICGMGGSAIGGSLAKELSAKIPITVVRDYQLPEFVSNKTLAVIVSYSGNTQETLACFDEAQRRKAKIIAITTGGKLAPQAEKKKIPLLQFEYASPPRAALGYLTIGLAAILARLNIIKIGNLKRDIEILKKFNRTLGPEKSAESSDKSEQSGGPATMSPKATLGGNPAKYLAYFAYDHTPLVIGAGHLIPVAQRWRDQLAENSKNFAFAEEAPEIFHNRVVGLEFPWRIKDEIVVIILESPLYRAEIKKRLKAFEKLLEKEKIQYWTVPGIDQNKLLDILWTILIGDWLSFYLSILNGTDPTPTENIDWMKKQI